MCTFQKKSQEIVKMFLNRIKRLKIIKNLVIAKKKKKFTDYFIYILESFFSQVTWSTDSCMVIQ